MISRKLLLYLPVIMLHLLQPVYAQLSKSKEIGEELLSIENNNSLPDNQKLKNYYGLKAKFEKLKLPEDSVLGRIYCLIGWKELTLNKNYNASILSLHSSLFINRSAKKNCSGSYAVHSYYYLAKCYNELAFYSKAFLYYDSTIALTVKYPHLDYRLLDSKLWKVFAYNQKGDYEKSADISESGILLSLKKKDTSYYLDFLIQKALALFYQNKINEALPDARNALDLSKKINDMYFFANACRILGDLYARKRDFKQAESFFLQAVQERKKAQEYNVLIGDYNAFGNFYRDSLHNFSKSLQYYQQGLYYATLIKDSVRLSRLNDNKAYTYLSAKKYTEADKFFNNALAYLKLDVADEALSNLSSQKISIVENKELLLDILSGKTKLLLHQYAYSNNVKYLNACLSIALLTDTVITETRHEQPGEQSKLYWRNTTRSFFTDAMEACYMAGNTTLAFYFMERSRAVLLNDKLNELGANIYLPDSLLVKLQTLQADILSQEQQLADIALLSPGYATQQNNVFIAKEKAESFISSLEKKFPSYYQYKYADIVPSLKDLQFHLAQNKQSFVHYFINDTVAYMLGITAQSTRLIKIDRQNFSSAHLNNFLQWCSDAQRQNNNFSAFNSVSHNLYQLLFQPLNIPKGKVIICPDNFMLPYESLSTNEKNYQPLVNNYIFSYVYSAGFFMKQFAAANASGNFIGFAPVQFQSYLHVVPLLQSQQALQSSASHYSNAELFTGAHASKTNFINSIAAYKVVNVFSHARADTSGAEPVLFMQDSLVRLTDLQLLSKTATRLVVLSACETNVGKNATGEGIYSLARGFALAGIPSVAATLWKADEQTIYSISEKFHNYITQGIPEDEALQKAKLDFLKTADKAHQLPCYWANMVFIGNAEILQLSTTSYTWIWIAMAITLIALAAFLFFRRRKINSERL